MSDARPRSAGSWLAFGALALYATLRWATMLPATDSGRLLLALALALATAGGVRRLERLRRRRTAGGLVGLLLVIDLAVLLLVAGFPLRWLAHLRVARIGSVLGTAVSGLSNVLVPYGGDDRGTIAVIVLGAGLLLLSAGLAFGTANRAPGTAPLTLASLPLLALAVVPSAIVTPRLVYFHGLVTFVLVALLVLSPRLAPRRWGGAAVLVGTAAVIGAIAAGVTAGGHLWIRVATAHAGGVTDAGGGPSSVEMFNWRQIYGQQGWPHSGTSVLEVTARRPAYWKAEDLDTFNGVSWTQGASRGDGLAGVSAAHRRAYSEQITVDVGQMVSTPVIAAGYAHQPDVVGVLPSGDPGAWVTRVPLEAGDSYEVGVYVPTPPAAQLAAAGAAYPVALSRFRHVSVSSAYAGVEALAGRLAAGTHTPYGYVEAVLDYLHRGFVYTLDPPAGGADPLAAFLLQNHRGYCQQFAGAMALLLRMRGVPARVAVGFSTGVAAPGSDTYVVSDRDAHAWVEVWFPSFGWVTFDPTPGQAAADGVGGTAGSAPAAAGSGAAAATRAQVATTAGHAGTTPQAASARQRRAGRPAGARPAHGLGGAGAAGARRRAGGGPSAAIIVAGLAAAAVLVWAMLRFARVGRGLWRRPSAAELSLELERAFARCGRPLGAGVTFAALAGQLCDSPAAAAYVNALAAARYAPGGGAPSPDGRAALRRWLAGDLGPAGRLRAAWALPPRRLRAA